MKRWTSRWILAFSSVGFLTGCTFPELGKVSQRLSESLSGSMAQPGNLDPTGINNFTFAIFGDTHVGSPFGHVLNEAIAHSKTSGDSFVIVSGDLTDNAQAKDFDTFIEAFASQDVPFRAAIGNHDIYFGGWANYKEKIGRSVYSIDVDNVHISFLDTAEGVIGQRQLNWLINDLKSTSQEIKIIVSHFSAYTGEIQSIWKLASDEEAAILKNIANDHNVSLVIGAHYHGYLQRVFGKTIFVTSGGANKLLDINEVQHYVRVTINGSALSVGQVKF